MKLKKGIPVIDQGDRLGFWGGKFGGKSSHQQQEYRQYDVERRGEDVGAFEERKF